MAAVTSEIQNKEINAEDIDACDVYSIIEQLEIKKQCRSLENIIKKCSEKLDLTREEIESSI